MTVIAAFDALVDAVADELISARMSINASLLRSGSTFPVTPVNGQRFVRTDLGQEFYWDSSRSNWLSTSEDICIFSGTPNTAYGFRLGEAFVVNGAAGILLPYSTTVTGLSLSTSSVESGALAIRKNGTAIFTLTVTASTLTSNLNLSLNCEAGENITLARPSTSTGAWTNAISVLYLRRRAS